MSNKSRDAREFENDDRYMSLSDSQDIDFICEYYGIMKYREDITGAMVIVGEGDYDEVWLTESSRPYSIYADYEPLDFYLD